MWVLVAQGRVWKRGESMKRKLLPPYISAHLAFLIDLEEKGATATSGLIEAVKKKGEIIGYTVSMEYSLKDKPETKA